MSKTSVFAQERLSVFDKIIYLWRRKMVSTYISYQKKVCDLGCGENGYLLRTLVDIISSGIGFDIKIDPQYKNEKIILKETDLNKPIPLVDDSVDIVLSLAVIEHLYNTEQHIKESFRILCSNGRLILTTPSPFARPILNTLSFLKLINENSIKDHKHYFNKSELISLCNQTGFKKVSFKYFQIICNQLIVAEK